MMTSLIETLHRRLAAVAEEGRLAPALDESLLTLTRGASPQRVTIEVIRFPGRRSKLLTVARFVGPVDLEPDPLGAVGFAMKRTSTALCLERAGESILAFPQRDEVRVEHAVEADDIPALAALVSLAAIPALAVFAPLAAGNATLVSWGLGRDPAHGRLGLVKIHRDLDRCEEDEAALHAAGLAETGEESVWATRDGGASLVWMGGTVYGYLGPVPESVGGWIGDE
jgi:hypothetical protein